MDAFLPCNACRKVVTRDTKFCPYCGVKDPSRETIKSPDPPEREDFRVPVATLNAPEPRAKGSARVAQHARTLSPAITRRIQDRYRHAYWVATVIRIIGVVLMLMGFALGLLGVIGTLFLAYEGNRFFDALQVLGYSGNHYVVPVLAVGLPISAIFFLLFFACGVFVSALAQMLRATVDTAVYASPFLDDDQRLEAMRIKRSKPRL